MTGLLDIFNYGTGNDFLNEKKKEIEKLERGSLYTAGGGDAQNTWRSRFNARHGIGITKDQNWVDAKTGSRNDLMKFMAQKEKENYTIKKEALDKTRRDYSVKGKTPITTGEGRKSYGMDLSQWHGNNQQEQLKWWQGLANKFNSKFNMDDAVASWKEKGGFEGLMANPAFTMGLAFMQAGAEGKTLGSGALNNVMKAAGISSHYKQILKDREEAPIEVTAQDVGEVKSLLQSMDISGPSNVEKFFGFLKGERKMEFKWDLASEEIAVELQKEIKKLKENKKPGAPEVVYDTTKKLQILKRMFDKGRFKKKGGTWFTDSTLQTTQEIPTLDSNKPKINKKNPLKGYVGFAQGGQIQEGQHAIVGEGGPEYFLPKESGKILSNDDSRIFAMLLAANPQLQQVSRTRSEKILRNRFPEYFE